MKKKILIFIVIIVVLFLLLSIPPSKISPFKPAGQTPFAWNQDNLWNQLESTFKKAKHSSTDALESNINASARTITTRLDDLENTTYPPDGEIFTQLENELFHLAAITSAYPKYLPQFADLCTRLRIIIKKQSLNWDMNTPDSRNRLYRLLYGSRAALEEAILQSPPNTLPNLLSIQDVPSQTPMAAILGINIHSGDILVSRGGAPTSALISRGNDYPGNFSHIALVHVDEKTHLPSIIEAHIEIGVAISNLETYIKDKKLRVMVLRIRPGHPAIVKDPTLPHKAATYALQNARNKYIPYDFQMDYKRHDKLFCSEVASAAYEQYGINLWMGISSISSPGLASWLAAFGVEHFETQEPSDLEYDPQLQVVGEWRDRDTLYKDHLDNAVIDVMLEGAENGERLSYMWFLLAPARVTKAYSVLMNFLGGTGPIPEGMSAPAALKNQQFSRRHDAMIEMIKVKADVFKYNQGYTPPYWELVKLARESKNLKR